MCKKVTKCEEFFLTGIRRVDWSLNSLCSWNLFQYIIYNTCFSFTIKVKAYNTLHCTALCIILFYVLLYVLFNVLTVYCTVHCTALHGTALHGYGTGLCYYYSVIHFSHYRVTLIVIEKKSCKLYTNINFNCKDLFCHSSEQSTRRTHVYFPAR